MFTPVRHRFPYTNHVGPFLLTALLLPKLKDRVVSVASSGHRLGELEFLEDYNFETRPYNAWLAYGQSKLANVLFANELARRTGLKAYSLHPGDIMTELLRNIDDERAREREELYPRVLADKDWEPIKMKALDNGCSTILVAALAPERDLPNGSYLANCQIGSPKATTRDAEAARSSRSALSGRNSERPRRERERRVCTTNSPVLRQCLSEMSKLKLPTQVTELLM